MIDRKSCSFSKTVQTKVRRWWHS